MTVDLNGPFWRPVPVRERENLSSLQKMLTGTEYVFTGEWKCTTANLVTYDLTPTGRKSKTCRVYHQTHQAAHKHCRELQRGEGKR